MYDDDIRQDKPHIDLDWASREGRTEDERWITRKDGFRFRALFSLIAIRDTGGDLRGFTHIVHEVEDEDAFLASGSPWTRKSG